MRASNGTNASLLAAYLRPKVAEHAHADDGGCHESCKMSQRLENIFLHFTRIVLTQPRPVAGLHADTEFFSLYKVIPPDGLLTSTNLSSSSQGTPAHNDSARRAKSHLSRLPLLDSAFVLSYGPLYSQNCPVSLYLFPSHSNFQLHFPTVLPLLWRGAHQLSARVHARTQHFCRGVGPAQLARLYQNAGS